jgi:hypothetical protein
MWRAFFCLLLITGVFAWLRLLARESSAANEVTARLKRHLASGRIMSAGLCAQAFIRRVV